MVVVLCVSVTAYPPTEWYQKKDTSDLHETLTKNEKDVFFKSASFATYTLYLIALSADLSILFLHH